MTIYHEPASAQPREIKHVTLQTDYAVIGGGIAGTVNAISAAREGLQVVLVQDRPVLGGNGSSEVRLWWLGATHHGLTNNRWAREGGIVDELLLENLYQNPEGNPEFVDVLMLDAVHREPNITLLLNTAADGVTKSDAETIESVTAYCAQNSTRYTINAPLFCDASGDGVVGFLAGAAFRMGAEAKDVFDEPLAPDESFGSLLGDSIYFYTKDAGRPVPFVPPSFAAEIKPEDIRMLQFYQLENQGCQLWWMETGGRYDTVHDAERIKWDLWKIVYGIWNYVKNSGAYPDAANLTLEWVGKIPGKRESRRFEGATMVRQQDVVEATPQPDTVGYAGWSIDLHPADGLYSKHTSATQYLMRSLWPIPYRALYSRNIHNLFLGGRTLSASHIAFGSARVMCTLGMLGEALGCAAALCHRAQVLPAAVETKELQLALTRRGIHLPQTVVEDPEDLAQTANVTASSTWQPNELPNGSDWLPLDRAQAQILPLSAGPLPRVTLSCRSEADTTLTVEWRVASRAESQTPDQLLVEEEITLSAGESQPVVNLEGQLPQDGFAYLILRENPQVAVNLSEQRATGLQRLLHRGEQRKGDSHGMHLAALEVGCEAFELWFPERRPKGKNLALHLDRPLAGFAAENVQGQLLRPCDEPNAWVADPAEVEPELSLCWKEVQQIQRVRISLDPDWDHPLETVLRRHPERIQPSLIQELEVLDETGQVIASFSDNRSTVVEVAFPKPVSTKQLTLRVKQVNGDWPAAIFGVRVYA